MSTTATDQPYSCHVHGPAHDLFLSYRVATDATTVQALKEGLVAVSKRRYGKPLSIFHDVDCLQSAQDWRQGFLGALPTSKAVFLLLSKASMELMKDKVISGQEDNVVLEIKTALDLKDAKHSLPVLPLGIATKETKDGVDVFTPFLPYMVSLPDDPAFASLKQTLGRMNQIQSIGVRPDQLYKRILHILNLIHPVQVHDGTRQVLDSLFCDSKFRVDPAHLNSLLKHLTLTGRAVISGMGGMGKSVLAIQILFFMMGIMNASNKEDLLAIKAETIGIKPQYSQVFWINCSTESTALDGLCEIFDGVEPDEIKKHAAKFLAKTRGYLLVLDNVDDIAVVDSVFEHSKSVGFSGDVVVTTRLASLPPGAFASALKAKIPGYKHDPLRLGNWDDSTTLDYIMSSSPMIVERLVSDEAKKSLDSIVAKISGYPLVIQTFMTFYENNEVPLSEIDRLFSKVLEEQDGEDDTRSSLKVIVDLSLDSIMKRGNEGIEAARLFGAVSLVAPANIQFELINEIAEQLELKTEVTDLIKMMVQSGLLRSGAEGQYLTHSLTQQVAREYVQAHEKLDVEAIEDATGEVLIGLTEPMDLKAQSFAEHLDQYAGVTVPDVYTKELHDRVEFQKARMAYKRPLYAKAMEAYTRNLERSVVFYGTREHPAVTQILNNMGLISRSQGHLDEAFAFYNESLSLRVKIYGTREHPDVAMTLNNMGTVANDQGRLDEAIAYHRESLDIKIKVYGTHDHPSVAGTLMNMGNVASAQGRLDEALAFYQESLDVNAKIYGTREHPDIAMALNNMGTAANGLGRLSEALAFYQEALEIMAKVYGTYEHPYAAQALMNMGSVALSRGHLDEALALFQESLDISVKVYGTREHPDVALALGNMGRVARLQGYADEAIAFYQESLGINVKVHGTHDHPGIAQILNSMGLLASDQGRLDEALAFFQEALGIYVKIYGTREHPDVASALNNMGLVAYQDGRPDEALAFYQEALDIKTRILGTREHPDVARILGNMGNAARSLGHWDEASAFYQQVLEIKVKIYGTREHPDVASTLTNIGILAEDRGDVVVALGHFREAHAIYKSVFGRDDHPLVIRASREVSRIEGQVE